MKKFFLKFAFVLRIIFGYGIMICLMVGGLTFFGYLFAIIIGEDTAAKICDIISKYINPILVLISTSMIVLGLISMYIAGDVKRRKVKKESAKSPKE